MPRSSANLPRAETRNLSKERSCGQVGNPKQISEAMGREDCSFNFDRVVHNALKVFSRYGIQIKQETGQANDTSNTNITLAHGAAALREIDAESLQISVFPKCCSSVRWPFARMLVCQLRLP